MYPVKEVNVPFEITIDKVEDSVLEDYKVIPSDKIIEIDDKIVATVTLIDYGVTIIKIVNEIVGLDTTVTVVGQKPVSKVEEKVDATRVELAEVSNKIDDVDKNIQSKLDMIEVGVQVTRVDVVTNVSRLADVLNRTVVYVRDNTLATDQKIVDLVAVIADKTKEIIEDIHALGGTDNGNTVSDLIDKIDALDVALTNRLAGQTDELKLLDPADKIELLSDKLGDSLVELKIKLDEQNEVMTEHTDSFTANKEAVSKVAKNVDDIETVVRENAEQIDKVRKKVNEASSVLGEVKDTGDLTRVDVAKTRDEMSGLSDLLHEVGDGLTAMTDLVTEKINELVVASGNTAGSMDSVIGNMMNLSNKVTKEAKLLRDKVHTEIAKVTDLLGEGITGDCGGSSNELLIAYKTGVWEPNSVHAILVMDEEHTYSLRYKKEGESSFVNSQSNFRKTQKGYSEIKEFMRAGDYIMEVSGSDGSKAVFVVEVSASSSSGIGDDVLTYIVNTNHKVSSINDRLRYNGI